MNNKPPAKIQPPIPKDIVKEIAMDIGKQVAHHVKTMYPKAVEATSSTFLLSVRNTTYNAIMAALDVTEEEDIKDRLEKNRKHRRYINAMKKCKTIEDLQKLQKEFRS